MSTCSLNSTTALLASVWHTVYFGLCSVTERTSDDQRLVVVNISMVRN